MLKMERKFVCIGENDIIEYIYILCIFIVSDFEWCVTLLSNLVKYGHKMITLLFIYVYAYWALYLDHSIYSKVY